MKRQSKIISISLPADVEDQLHQQAKFSHRSKSEIIKQLILGNQTINQPNTSVPFNPQNTNQPDISQIVKRYYELSSMKTKQHLVIGLGIIVKDGQILIGKRAKKDSHIPHLSWVFPGGRMQSLDLNLQLIQIIKAETNLTVHVDKLIHARLHPDNRSTNLDIIALYFSCQVIKGKEKPGQYEQSIPISQLKWVKPTTVYQYFTSSTAQEVATYLRQIEQH